MVSVTEIEPPEIAPKTDIPGAEKKLRQAVFFLDDLREASSPSARSRTLTSEGHLESLFSSFLSAAKSVLNVLEKTGGPGFQEIQQRWRAQLSEPERTRFKQMIDLRNDDVHEAVTGAAPLQKYVAEDWWERDRSPYQP